MANYTGTDWQPETQISTDIMATIDEGLGELNADLTDIDLAGGLGTRITSGSDLDDYIEPGKYYISSGSDASNIANCPITNAGSTLFVIRAQTGNRREQILIEPLTNREYRRGRSDSAWGDWDYNILSADLTDIDAFGIGTAISSGDDLNDYTEVGKYYSASSTISGSLSNCPTNNGFSLHVLRQSNNSNYRYQIITDNANSAYIYVRFLNAGSGNWFRISTTAV